MTWLRDAADRRIEACENEIKWHQMMIKKYQQVITERTTYLKGLKELREEANKESIKEKV